MILKYDEIITQTCSNCGKIREVLLYDYEQLGKMPVFKTVTNNIKHDNKHVMLKCMYCGQVTKGNFHKGKITIVGNIS